MSVKDFIDQEYMCLDDDYLDAVTRSVPMTIRLREDYSLMLQGIADVFKKTRSALAADFLRISVDEAFYLMSPEHRRMLADKVDIAYQGCKGHWNNQVLALDLKESQANEDQAA